jgi:hypothetical protein
MALIEFACPHCRGQFQLDNPPAGGQVACPLCRQVLAIPTDLPPAVAGFDFAPPQAAGGARGVKPPPLAFDPDEASAVERPSRRRKSPPPNDVSVLEPLSRQRQDRRRQMRGLAWMIGGILLLAIAAAVLSRL